MRFSRHLICAVAFLGTQALAFAEVLPEQPLPLVDDVLQAMLKRAERETENDREFRERYSFTRVRVTEYRDSDGDIKSRKERKSVNNPQRAEEATAETEPESEKAPDTSRDTKSRGKAFNKDEFFLNDDLMSRFRFTVTGRESLNGRPMLIVEFQPAKGNLPEKDLKDRFINKAAGRLWIDEADYALVKATLRLTDSVNIVGGLIASVRKFNYSFARERTDDGLWFTRDVQWHLEGRQFLSRRTIDYREERSDVRRQN